MHAYLPQPASAVCKLLYIPQYFCGDVIRDHKQRGGCSRSGLKAIKMKERSPRPWTPEDDERLRKLANEGRTTRTIAECLKRTPDATRTRAKALNIVIVKATSGVPWSNAEDKRLRELAQAGLSFVEIAAEMRRSTSMVRRHAEILQIKIARGANVMKSTSMAERLTRLATSSPSERTRELQCSVSASKIGAAEK
jgi:hypothetical protein